jgi:hypoxanthine phosphoribosyltransferase
MTKTEIVGILVSVAGAITSLYYGIRAKRAERDRFYYDWPALQAAARSLARKVRGQFAPDVLVGVHGGGTIVASLLLFEFEELLPVRTVFLVPREPPARVPASIAEASAKRLTTKFEIFVPNDFAHTLSLRFLLVDDCTVTGQSLSEVRAALLEMGVPAEHIRTAAAVCCQSAVNALNAPDFYWLLSPTDSVYFPWGSGQRLQRLGVAP